MIVLIESHRQERADLRPEVVAIQAGARWGNPAEFGFDRDRSSTFNGPRAGAKEVRADCWSIEPQNRPVSARIKMMMRIIPTIPPGQ